MTTPDPALTDDMLGELKALAASATPGPWSRDGDKDYDTAILAGGEAIAYAETHNNADRPRDDKFFPGKANADLIAAARNALPALISAASRTQAAEAEVERLREA